MGRGIRPKPKHIGSKFRLIREHLGLTQTEMCERLGFKMIKPNQILEYESGKREPPYPVTLKIARMARVSTDILIDDEIEFPKGFRAEASIAAKRE
jgi:transcriptional regulator with XRE-family HTH domain